VGKTTLSAHFTEYLAEHEYPVAAVDADLQASLSRHRERDVKEDPKRPLPWEVIKLNTFDGEKVKAVVKKLKQVDGIIVVDCPGNLNDNNLSILFEAADFIVIPMAFDIDTIDATNIFINVVKKRSKAKLLFLPNRINVSEGRAQDLIIQEKNIKDLNKVGKVMPRIKQSVVIKRYTTIYPLDMYQYMALEEPFEAIIKEIKKKK
jgi:chromosome partitioning protein